jgi:hypothetical protein
LSNGKESSAAVSTHDLEGEKERRVLTSIHRLEELGSSSSGVGDGLKLGCKHSEGERSDEDRHENVDDDSGIRSILIDEDDTVDEGEAVGSVDDEEHDAETDSGDDSVLDADGERGTDDRVELSGEPRLGAKGLGDPDRADDFLGETRGFGDVLETGDL